MKQLIKWKDIDKLTIVGNGLGNLSDDYQFIYKLLDDERCRCKYYEFNARNFVVMNNQTFKKDDRIKNVLVGGVKKRYYGNDLMYYSTEYQSLYPENFYQFWEVLCLSKLVTDGISNIGFIDDGLSIHESLPLGHIEATIRYAETYTRYEGINNARILLNPLVKHSNDDKFMAVYRHNTYEFTKSGYNPKLPLRIQKYFAENKVKFDLLIATCDSIFRNMIALLLSPKGGNVIMYVSNYLSDNYLRTIQYVSKFFKRTILIKPSVINRLDPCCYIVCTGFIGIDNNGYLEILKTIQNEYVYDLNIDYIKQKLDSKYRRAVVEYLDMLRINTSTDIKQYFNECKPVVQKSLDWLSKYGLKLHSRFDTQIIISPENDNQEYVSYKFKKNALKMVDFSIDDIFEFSIDELHAIKRRLNVSKRYIDTREQFVSTNLQEEVIDWKRLSDCIDLFRNLRRSIAWKTGAEMTGSGWTRFYEILDVEHLFDEQKHTLRTFHLCEAPGSFIGCLNHYVRTKTNVKNFIWYAQSLNPRLSFNNDPMMSDSFGLMRTYPGRWLFGEVDTGDITDSFNIQNYKLDENLQNIDLITADGSVIVPESMYNEQEQFMAKLVFAQVLTILYVLPETKNCVFKAFTPFSETLTVSLFYILSSTFNEFKIVKPKTCHSTNSDVYVICKNYYGWENINESIQNRLFYFINNFSPTESIIPRSMITDEFITELEKCSKLFVEKQIQAIDRTLWYYDRFYFDPNIQYEMTHRRNEIVDEWIQEYDLKPIDPADHIIKKMKNKLVYEKQI